MSTARELFANALVWDAHAGVFPDPTIDLTLLNDWRDNGGNYISINVGFDLIDWRKTLATLAAYRRWILMHDERFVLAANVGDVARAKQQGKLAVSFDIEGMNALNGDINMIGLYHGLGVRQMLFAYNLNNEAAGGCHDVDIGLSEFGRDIVGEINRVGMIVDCSHASCRTAMDIMEQSNKPVVFSHSNPTAVCAHQRNITDKQIRACAETGGVIGINGMGIFLDENDSSNEVLMRHIRYVSDLVGAEHVGLGFDYSPKLDIDIGDILKSNPNFWPPGQKYDTLNITHASPMQVLELTQMLMDDGFSDNEIRGILGGNFHRIAEAVWMP